MGQKEVIRESLRISTLRDLINDASDGLVNTPIDLDETTVPSVCIIGQNEDASEII